MSSLICIHITNILLLLHLPRFKAYDCPSELYSWFLTFILDLTPITHPSGPALYTQCKNPEWSFRYVSQVMSLLHSTSYNGLPISLSIAAKFLLIAYKVQVTITFLTVSSYSLSYVTPFQHVTLYTFIGIYQANACLWTSPLPLSLEFASVRYLFYIGLNFHLLLYLVQHYNHPINPFFFTLWLCFISFIALLILLHTI